MDSDHPMVDIIPPWSLPQDMIAPKELSATWKVVKQPPTQLVWNEHSSGSWKDLISIYTRPRSKFQFQSAAFPSHSDHMLLSAMDPSPHSQDPKLHQAPRALEISLGELRRKQATSLHSEWCLIDILNSCRLTDSVSLALPSTLSRISLPISADYSASTFVLVKLFTDFQGDSRTLIESVSVTKNIGNTRRTSTTHRYKQFLGFAFAKVVSDESGFSEILVSGKEGTVGTVGEICSFIRAENQDWNRWIPMDQLLETSFRIRVQEEKEEYIASPWNPTPPLLRDQNRIYISLQHLRLEGNCTNYAIETLFYDQDDNLEGSSLPLCDNLSVSGAKLYSSMSPCTFNLANPSFDHEVAIDLPAQLHSSHHVLFRIIDLKSTPPAPIGYSLLPLYHDQRLADQLNDLVVFKTLPREHYLLSILKFSPESVFDPLKSHLRVRVRPHTCLYPSDPLLNRVFDNIPPSIIKPIQRHSSQQELPPLDQAKETMMMKMMRTCYRAGILLVYSSKHAKAPVKKWAVISGTSFSIYPSAFSPYADIQINLGLGTTKISLGDKNTLKVMGEHDTEPLILAVDEDESGQGITCWYKQLMHVQTRKWDLFQVLDQSCIDVIDIDQLKAFSFPFMTVCLGMLSLDPPESELIFKGLCKTLHRIHQSSMDKHDLVMETCLNNLCVFGFHESLLCQWISHPIPQEQHVIAPFLLRIISRSMILGIDSTSESFFVNIQMLFHVLSHETISSFLGELSHFLHPEFIFQMTKTLLRLDQSSESSSIPLLLPLYRLIPFSFPESSGQQFPFAHLLLSHAVQDFVKDKPHNNILFPFLLRLDQSQSIKVLNSLPLLLERIPQPFPVHTAKHRLLFAVLLLLAEQHLHVPPHLLAVAVQLIGDLPTKVLEWSGPILLSSITRLVSPPHTHPWPGLGTFIVSFADSSIPSHHIESLYSLILPILRDNSSARHLFHSFDETACSSFWYLLFSTLSQDLALSSKVLELIPHILWASYVALGTTTSIRPHLVDGFLQSLHETDSVVHILASLQHLEQVCSLRFHTQSIALEADCRQIFKDLNVITSLSSIVSSTRPSLSSAVNTTPRTSIMREGSSVRMPSSLTERRSFGQSLGMPANRRHATSGQGNTELASRTKEGVPEENAERFLRLAEIFSRNRLVPREIRTLELLVDFQLRNHFLIEAARAQHRIYSLHVHQKSPDAILEASAGKCSKLYEIAGLPEYCRELEKDNLKRASRKQDWKKAMNLRQSLRDLSKATGEYYLGVKFRTFGMFYRVVSGDNEWIYREQGLSRLPEIKAALTKFMPDVQVTSVFPYFAGEDSPLTDFAQFNKLSSFTFSTPFTLSGGTHGSMEEQCKRVTVLRTEHSFPHLTRRIKVCERTEIVLSPVENACEDIRARNRKLEQEIYPPNGSPDLQTLSQVLSGSVCVQVNAGIGQVVQVFLSKPSSGNVRLLHTLRQSLILFFRLIRQALPVARGLCETPDQLALHKECELGHQRLWSYCEKYILEGSE